MRDQSSKVNLTGLQEMLAARENRAIRQRTWLERWRSPIVSLTLVSPGPEKYNQRYSRCMNAALKSANALFSSLNYTLHDHEVFWLATGPEALWSLDADPAQLKRHLISLEDEHRLGRLWDFDVIAPGSGGISRSDYGLNGRKCLLCDGLAHACSRSRAHSITELTRRIEEMIDEFTDAE